MFSKPLLRAPRFFRADIIKDREAAQEKEYIIREENKKLKKLRKTLKDKAVQDDEYFYLESDTNVEEILADRETVIRLLAEHGVVHNEKLVKRLLQWKHE